MKDSAMLKVYAKTHHHEPATDELWLPYDLRKRGRLKSVTSSGADIGLFLERGEVLKDGDRLATACGRIVEVRAAPEEIAIASTDDPLLFARACYHLGNRHVPLQIEPGRLCFQRDAVLEELATRLGLKVSHQSAPFDPEPGAYAGGHSHD